MVNDVQAYLPMEDEIPPDDAPPVEFPSKDTTYHSNGLLHRLNGPAVEHPDGGKEWWVDGKCHRKNGPAVELKDGTREWHYKGRRFYGNPTPENMRKWQGYVDATAMRESD